MIWLSSGRKGNLKIGVISGFHSNAASSCVSVVIYSQSGSIPFLQDALEAQAPAETVLQDLEGPHLEGPKQYLPPRTSDTVETHAQCASTSQTQWNQVLSPMSAPGEDLLQSPGCQGVLTVPVALPLPVSQRLPLGRGVRLGFNLSLLRTLRNSIIFTDASSAHMGSHREPRAWSKLGQ